MRVEVPPGATRREARKLPPPAGRRYPISAKLTTASTAHPRRPASSMQPRRARASWLLTSWAAAERARLGSPGP